MQYICTSCFDFIWILNFIFSFSAILHCIKYFLLTNKLKKTQSCENIKEGFQYHFFCLYNRTHFHGPISKTTQKPSLVLRFTKWILQNKQYLCTKEAKIIKKNPFLFPYFVNLTQVIQISVIQSFAVIIMMAFDSWFLECYVKNYLLQWTSVI